jgi:hypothetical protein
MKKLSILPIVLLALMAAYRPVPAVSEPAAPEPALPEPAASEAAAWQASQVIEGTITAEEPVDLPAQPWEGQVISLPGPQEELEKAALRPGFTTFTNSVTVGRKRYSFTEVGTDPSLRNTRNAVVPVVVIPVQAIFDDGTVLDSTASDPCSGGQVPFNLVAQSPIVQNVNYGDGARQYEEEFRRLEFWSFTGAAGARNPNYSVRATFYAGPRLSLTVHGFPTQRAGCGRLGLIDINSWDPYVQATIFPQLRNLGVGGPSGLVLFLFTNVVFYNHSQSNCCTLGYHSWFSFHGLQTYGVAEFDSNRSFKAGADVSILAHELGEWYDDPLTNNPTPPWGHTGQVSGCQGNLEVGDPLTGHFLDVPMPNGIVYHPQELAFFSWFFHENPSLGFDGWYSMGGTFRTPAAACH